MRVELSWEGRGSGISLEGTIDHARTGCVTATCSVSKTTCRLAERFAVWGSKAKRSKPWASPSKKLTPTPERLGTSPVLVAARVKLASLYNARMERTTDSRVRHAMFANLEWVTETEPLDAALEYMERRGAGVMPVRSADGRPRGCCEPARSSRPGGPTAGEACSTWISIDADASLEEALRFMESERLGRVPVEADGKVVGGITRGDILDYQGTSERSSSNSGSSWPN